MPIIESWNIPSELTGLNTYRDKFESLLTKINNSWISESDIFKLTLGFDEALVNAIKYGNKEDSALPVVVNINIDKDKLKVSLLDTNPDQFSPDTAFNSVTNASERLANHGRGITLMKESYDSVIFEFMEPGNKVTMVKHNPEPRT